MSTPEERIAEAMQSLAGVLDRTLAQIGGEQMGFCLMVFPLERRGTANRISNVATKDLIYILEQTVEWVKRGKPDLPQAPARAVH